MSPLISCCGFHCGLDRFFGLIPNKLAVITTKNGSHVAIDRFYEEGFRLKIYKFLSDLSFYSLTFEKEGELDKFLHLYDNHYGKSVKSLWQPLRVTIVEGKESFPASDFPHLAAGFPVMSRGAKEALYDLISPYVEFLPLQSSFGGEYYGINVLEEVDALDERFPNGRVMVIRKYVFKPDAVRDKVIFRIPQQRSVVFITDTFVDRVREHGLTGLELKELWSAGFSERKQKAGGKTNLNDPQFTPINGRDFIEQFKERLKKTDIRKNGI